jgi:uncharacterized protein
MDADRPAPPWAGSALRWGGHELVLLPGKAVWLPERRWLLVADVHLGKAASFRQLGVPVPEGTTNGTLDRLGALLDGLGAQALVVLGDLLHSAHAQSPSLRQALRAWRQRHGAVRMTLVRGNHDSRAGDPCPTIGIEVVDEPWLVAPADRASAGLALCHHPRAVPGHEVLAGHDHPCVRLAGRGRDHLRLPCFHFRDGVGVLPAFGDFTGMHPVQRAPGDRVFVVTADAVRPLAPAGPPATPPATQPLNCPACLPSNT